MKQLEVHVNWHLRAPTDDVSVIIDLSKDEETKRQVFL